MFYFNATHFGTMFLCYVNLFLIRKESDVFITTQRFFVCFDCFFGMILIGFIHPRSLSCMIVFFLLTKYSYSYFHNYLDLRVVFISNFDSTVMRSNVSFNSCSFLGLETSQETNFKSETYERLVEILNFSRILKFIHHNVSFLTI